MYRCELCGRASEPGEARKVHQVKRPDGQTDREVPVCNGCSNELRYRPLAELYQEKRDLRLQNTGKPGEVKLHVPKPVVLGEDILADGADLSNQ
jgi:hypothetical protein